MADIVCLFRLSIAGYGGALFRDGFHLYIPAILPPPGEEDFLRTKFKRTVNG